MAVTRRRFLTSLAAGAASLGALDALFPRTVNGDLLLKNQGIFGSYVSGFTPNASAFTALESKLNHQLGIISWFVNWGSEDIFNASYLAAVGSRIPLIAVEPWNVKRSHVLSGSQDAWLQGQAAKAIAYGKPVYIRPWHEANGNWYPWQAGLDGTSADAVAAWQHVVNLFRAAGATNVKFVFCINTYTVGGAAPKAYWPGSAYVDLLGVDGYSWDQGATSFDSAMADGYGTLTALDSSLPVWVCETGCGQGSKKATWINGMFASTKFPRMTGVAYFSENKEQDWRIDSSSASLAAFAAGLGTATARSKGLARRGLRRRATRARPRRAGPARRGA
jgi:hypothetical protein